MKKTIKMYACTTDWSTELWIGSPELRLFTTQAALKRARPCYKECGMVEVQVKFIKEKIKGKGPKY